MEQVPSGLKWVPYEHWQVARQRSCVVLRDVTHKVFEWFSNGEGKLGCVLGPRINGICSIERTSEKSWKHFGELRSLIKDYLNKGRDLNWLIKFLHAINKKTLKIKNEGGKEF